MGYENINQAPNNIYKTLNFSKGIFFLSLVAVLRVYRSMKAPCPRSSSDVYNPIPKKRYRQPVSKKIASVGEPLAMQSVRSDG